MSPTIRRLPGAQPGHAPAPSEISAVIGPDGAGKTTLFNVTLTAAQNAGLALAGGVLEFEADE